MPVEDSMFSLTTVAASNSPRGSDVIGTTLDDYLRSHATILRRTQELTSVALRGRTGSTGDLVYVQGANAAGDGGGGLWRWDATSTATDNLGTVLLPTGSFGAGRWLRQYGSAVDVRWFGASGDGTTDDSAAIRAAIRGAVSAGNFSDERDPTGAVYFPAGVYRIRENGLFSDYDDLKRNGILCYGDGSGNSIVWMDPLGLVADTWFYDNSTTNRAWGSAFRDMTFAGGVDWSTAATGGISNFSQYCCGFKPTGGGWESSFSFHNVEFRYLKTVISPSGSNNSDSHILIDCEFAKCQDIVALNNTQALSVTLSNCYASLMWGDVVRWDSGAAGGAGNVRIDGGAYILDPDNWGGGSGSIIDAATYGPASNSGTVNIRDGRFELRGNGSSIGNFSAGGTSAGTAIFSFDGCTFTKTGATGSVAWVTARYYKEVSFNNCSFAATTYQPILVIDDNARYGKNATIRFSGCRLSSWDDWTLTFTSGYGKVITENCWASEATVTSPWIRVINGQVNGTLNQSTTARGEPIMRVQPLISGTIPQGNGNGESDISLPRGATLLRVRLYLAASTAGATAHTYRILVGNDDKSVVYASSTAGAQNAGFTVDESVCIKMGTVLADRTIRVWADDGSGGSVAAGVPTITYAGLEYI